MNLFESGRRWSGHQPRRRRSPLAAKLCAGLLACVDQPLATLLFATLLATPLAMPAQQAVPQQAEAGQAQGAPRELLTPGQAPVALRLNVPRLEHDLTLNDFADMKPAPALQDKLAHVPEMVQNQPADGKPATEHTEVWLGRTETTLFAVFICYDHRPATIRGHLARRENIGADDSVGLLLDTFEDRRHGVLFQLNPAGVQADANWTDSGGDPDYSYDQVWNSDARRTAKGWMAMMAIPFRSIRSRAASPEWGVVFTRSLPRNSETDYWPRISQQVSGVLSQEGALLGMEGATSHNIQMTPYGLLQRVKELNLDDPAHPYFHQRDLGGTAGGDVKAVVKDTIVLDGTINPDFSQIESDEPQFRINQRYAVFYPELRPFFLENAGYFDTPITLLYTRTVVNPEFGARATGKIGHTNIGFLAIDDRAPGRYVAADDPLHGKRAYTTVARVSEDLGKLSSIGGIYAQRTLAGSANRVGGIDFVARLNQHWTARGMMVESSTRHTDGSYNAGPASRLSLQRSGHSFYFNEQYRDFSSGYETDTGFVTIPSVRDSRTNVNYQWYPAGSTARRLGLQSYGLETSNRFAFNRRGERVFHYSQGDFFFAFANNTVIAPLLGQNSDTLGPTDFSQLTRRVNYTQNYTGLVFRTAPRPQFSINVNATHGAVPNYSPVGTQAPTLLKDTSVQAMLTLQPVGSLTVDNTYLLDRTTEARTGAHVYESQTMRTKINYQFTRALSARAIVEYDSVGRNALLSSLDRTKQVSTELLVTWLPHPGTAIYLGYDSDLQNLDRALCNRLANGGCNLNEPDPPRSTQYLNDGRNLFLKASYLLRF